jgi:dihydroflavonol-4-reductase
VLPFVILRPAIVYGPRDKDALEYVKLLSRRIKPALFRGRQRFSFCYVEDLIRAILLAADREVRSGDIFFLTDGGDYGWKEIGAAFSDALGVRPLAVPVPKWALLSAAPLIERVSRLSRRPLPLSRGKVQEMIRKDWACDTTKAQNLLGFAPQTRLPQGAQLTVDWYRRQKWL